MRKLGCTMRKLLWLFFFALPLAAQVNTPTVKYVGSAPTGSCSQAPPVQVLNSSGAIYTCDNGIWAVSGGGSGTPASPVGSIQTNVSGSFGAIPVKATTQAPSASQFVFKGDSLTLGFGLTEATQSYPAQFGNCTLSGSPLKCTATGGKSFAGPSAVVVNLGVSAETLHTALTNYTTEMHPYCIQATSTVPVYLHLEEGINDIRVDGVSAATLEGYMTSYWADAVADGCTVTAATLTPTGDLTTGEELIREAVNEWMRSQVGLYSYLDDLAQYLPNDSDLVWYQADTIHYTASATFQVANLVNGIWSGKSGFQTLQPVIASGIFTSSFTPSSTVNGVQCGNIGSAANCSYVNSAAALNQKIAVIGIGNDGILNMSFDDDAYTTGTTFLSIARGGYIPGAWTLLGTAFNFAAPAMSMTGTNPCWKISDSSGTADAFFGNYVNIGLFGVNRNPCTGGIADSGKSSASVELVTAATGATSSVVIGASTTSTPATVATFDNTGLNLPTGEAYQINSVAGFSGTKTAGLCTFTIVGGIITNVTGC